MSPPEPLPTVSAPGRPARPLLIGGGLLTCLLLGVIGAASYAGYHAGLNDRSASQRATAESDLRAQYDLGIADLNAGRNTLAVDRFQYVLAIDPNYPGAAIMLARAQAALQVTPRAATPVPVGNTPAEIFALAQEYSLAQNWSGVISQLTLLHAVDPTYEAVKADGLLFVALRNRGVERIQGDEMEAGIFDLDQAEAFGPLDGDAANYRAWARLYLAAQSYWGVNWQQTVQILQQLYVLAPNFHDTARKLNEATLKYAAQLAAGGDVCGAAEQYAASQALFADASVAEAQATAQAACLLVTPTPDVTAHPATATEAALTPVP